jgi:hypothetical protein
VKKNCFAKENTFFDGEGYEVVLIKKKLSKKKKALAILMIIVAIQNK